MISYDEFFNNFQKNTRKEVIEKYTDCLKYLYDNFIININNIEDFVCYGYTIDPAIMLILYFNDNLKISTHYYLDDFINKNDNIFFSISYNGEHLISNETSLNKLKNKINIISTISKMVDL